MTKRVAESQITKDDIEHSVAHDDGASTETRSKASEEVLSARKIVSVRRSCQSKPESSTSTPIPNESLAPESKSLFSGLSLGGDAAVKAAEVPSPEKPKSLFGGLSGLVASTESKSTTEEPDKGLFSSLFAPLDTSSSSTGFGSFSFSAPSADSGAVSFPSFGAPRGDTPEEEGQESSEAEEEEEPPTIQTVVDHGENEEQIYQSDCKLYKLQKVEDESKPNTMKWVEKGIGFVRIIKATPSEEVPTFRVVVRMKGVFRLMLNTALIPSICKAEKVGNKSVKFTAAEDGNLADFRLNLLTEDNQASFVALLPTDLIAQAEK